MIAIDGIWYDGKTSAQVKAVCRVYGDGSVRVERYEDGHLLLGSTRGQIQVSPRLADTPRYLIFPGGEKLETADHASLERFDSGGARFLSLNLVHRLESRWRFVLVAFAGLLLFLFVGVTYVLPVISKAVAFRLPAAVLHVASLQTLEFLDRSLLQPSRLETERQEQLLAHFEPIIQDHEAYHPTVLFRKGHRMGANAFALPDGTIVITDEMVRLSHKDDELFSVLAHELGHVVHRHGMRSLIQDSLLGFVLLAMTGDVSGSSELFLGLPVFLTEMAYSRQFEREADQYALDYLRTHQISPRHFAVLMEKIENDVIKKGRKNGGHWLSYLSTHPAMETRIRKFKEASE